MIRSGRIVVGILSGLGALHAGPTAPVNPAERNTTFAPETQTSTPTVKQPAQEKKTTTAEPARATVNKAPAAVAGKEAAIDRTPQAKTMVPQSTVTRPSGQTMPGKVTVITGSETLLRPQDHPVRSKAGSKFQSALNEARAASAVRAEQYKKDAKLEKVNEFVPNAPAPGPATRAGSEPISKPTP